MPAHPAPASTNLVRLNAAVEKMENLERDFETHRDKNIQRFKILRGELDVLRQQHRMAKERITYLESFLDIEDAGEVGASPGADGNAGAGEQDAPDPDEHAMRVALSLDAAKSKPVKNTVNKVFKHLLGVTSLSAKHLPAYPYGISREMWPKDASTGKTLLRLRWSQPATDSANAEELKRVLEFVRVHGPAHHSLVIPFLADLHDEHLMERIKIKYDYMAGQYRRYAKGVAAEVEAGEEDDEDDGFEEPVVDDDERVPSVALGPALPPPVSLGRAQLNSRARSKLDARIRKRAFSKYADPKYDAAFILSAMSADEDDPDGVPGEPKRWRSRAPDYRSELAQAIYDDIDARADPDVEKAKLVTERTKGPPIIHSAPLKAKLLKNRIRAWQVKAATLEANPQWITSKRVAISGTAWGDTEDPVEEAETREDDEAGKQRGKKKARRAIDDSGVIQSKARLAEIAGGTNVNAIFEDDV